MFVSDNPIVTDWLSFIVQPKSDVKEPKSDLPFDQVDAKKDSSQQSLSDKLDDLF